MDTMITTELILFRFLLASVGCVVAGLGVWTLTLLGRHVATLSMQRSTWLLAQLTIVAAFFVILLPHSERLRVVPPIDLDEAAQLRLSLPAPFATQPQPTHGTPAPAAAAAGPSWLAVIAQAWLAVYLVGLSYSVMTLLQARRLLHNLATAGELAAGPATLPVIEIDAPISPMLFGLFKPRLLLPRHVRQFDPLQQKMILEHELTHLRRHDLQVMHASVLLQTLFWFNPFMRMLRAHLGWAQELGCDRDVLRHCSASHRKAYASALVRQLTVQRQPVGAALAFGAVSASTLAARIALIRTPLSRSAGIGVRCAVLALLAGILAASLAFQPALASRTDAAIAGPFSCTDVVDAASGASLLREGRCDERVTPASTFNIVVSLMGYDSGILKDEHTPSLPFKPGYPDWIDSWKATTDPTSWLSNSVVWYAQQVTTGLGTAQFKRYIDALGYGNQDVSGDTGKNNGLTMAWISSSLKISPVEQVAFLRKFVNRKLPLAPKAYEMTERIMPTQRLANGWVVHGKTGTAAPVLPDGRDDVAHQYGWYVGWAKKGERTIVFARLIQDKKREDLHAGFRARQAFLHDLETRLAAI